MSFRLIELYMMSALAFIYHKYSIPSFFRLEITVYVLAMVGHLKNVSPTFAQMPVRITNVELTTVSPTIANTMLAVRALFNIQYFLSWYHVE